MLLRGWTLVLAGIENLILINAALSTAAFGAVYLLRVTGRVRSWHPHVQSRLYAMALLTPPVVSVWLVSAALLPATWLGGTRWTQEHETPHALHLLNAFTLRLDPLLGYTAFVFTVVAALIATYAALSAYFRINRVIGRLEIGAEPALPERISQVETTCRRHGISVGLVYSNYPFSFVWGYMRSKLVVSTGLLNTLSSAELAALLEHEAAHHARRDNLSRLGLTVCRSLSPMLPFTKLLFRWWSEQVEMVCDEIATQHTLSPIELAGALVRLKRLTLLAPSPALRPTGSSFFGESSDNFEHRVERVLSLADRTELRTTGKLTRSCIKLALTMGVTFALSLALLFTISPLAIHKAVETILHVF